MLERIQKIISAAGVTSRRAAEALITEGRVRVNGQVVTELGSKADASKDHIKVDGKLINPHQPKTYIMLNKPVGFVTTMSDPEGRPTVQDLLKGVKVRVYPVGRLDYNTEGMLIMTNDGDFAHLVTHPKHELPKTYLAKLKGVLDEDQIASIETGLFLDDGKTAPAKLKKIRKEEANSWVEITITEGRKRQVRRMFDRVGRSVIKLKRIRTGNLVLGDLPEGTFRYLTPVEVQGLMDLSQKTEVKPLKPLSMAKPVAAGKEGPSAGGSGMGARSPRPEYREGTAGRGREKRGPMKYDARKRPTGAVVMQDTSDGRRKNQIIKPRTANEPEWAIGRSTRPSAAHKHGDSHRSATAGAAIRKTVSIAPMGNREARRIPAQRSWAGTKNSESRGRGSSFATREEGRRPSSGPRRDKSAFTGRKGPGRAADFAPRGDNRYSPTSRPATNRSTMRTGSSRPAAAAASGRTETGRKPAPRSWSGGKSSDSRSKGAGYETRSEGRWKSSGPRPNKSIHTGGRGPGPRQKPGSRRPGQGASNRGPRR